MSKSDPSDMSRIHLTDSDEDIAQKIRKAKTDPEPLPDNPHALEGRPEAKNLVGIYAAVTGESVEQVLARFAGQGFGAFKPALADALVGLIAPIRERLDDLRRDPAELDRILAEGAARASELGAPVLARAKAAVGLAHSRALALNADRQPAQQRPAAAVAAAGADRRRARSRSAVLHRPRSAASLACLGRPAAHLRRDQRAAAAARHERVLRPPAHDRLGADGARTDKPVVPGPARPARSHEAASSSASSTRSHGSKHRVERIFKPRLASLTGPAATRVIGAVCFLLALVAAIPIPLFHVAPAAAIVLFGLALIYRDGALVIVAAAAAVASVIVDALVDRLGRRWRSLISPPGCTASAVVPTRRHTRFIDGSPHLVVYRRSKFPLFDPD